MKIALVQINPVIGDFAENCHAIVLAAEQALIQGCELAIFPEMVVSGYPPQDLLERQSFLEDHDRAVAQLVSDLPPSLAVMFGCLEQRQGLPGKPLYNSVVVAKDGAIVHRVRKQLLPSYDVFDETRYFEPGPETELYQLGGMTFAVTVCEDIWYEATGHYCCDPVASLFTGAKEHGSRIDCLINVSASPFQRDKEVIRHAIFRSLCSRYQVPFLYVNQVGGQDSLLFDGRSLAMNSSSEIVAKGAGFIADMVVVDTENWRGEMHGPVQEEPVASVYSGLVMGVRDYVRKCGFRSVVLGLSGGIDSALTATIAADALGAENVLGVALPSPYSSVDSQEDAEALAHNLGCPFKVIPISSLFLSFQQTLQSLFSGLGEDLTEQNLQARIRGNLLMALSNKFGHLLLSTGNKSEMAVGYCTLYGDMSGGLAVISDVPKQMVYELARYVNRDQERIPVRTLTKAPTAELKPDQCDQDDLPPYAILDQILELHLEQGAGLTALIQAGFDESVVRDVLRRIRLNEYKRKQAPMGLKVTSKAFGYGRRYPNVQNYQE
ncbi:MAG: NAD+ synthase [Desulfocapsaceae bacterium]|nr:NAD+ synthase [Desulfocapsaceae bacterium]